MSKHSSQLGLMPLCLTGRIQKRRHLEPQVPQQQHAVFAIQNPITLPEILILIGEYLDNRTVLSCLRVCKEWHNLLLPRVWFEVGMTQSSSIDGSFFLEIQKHFKLVRKLCVLAPKSGSDFFGGKQLHFPNLREFDIYPMRPNSSDDVDEELIVTFIKAHRTTLRKVNCFLDTSDGVLDALEECSCLQQLTVRSTDRIPNLQEQWKSRFDKLWSRTKFLTFAGVGVCTVTIEDRTAIDVLGKMMTQVGVTGIQRLELCRHVHHQSTFLEDLVLIMKSPALRSLKWHVRGINAMFLLATAAHSHQFGQQLDSLSLYTPFRNRHFQAVLQSLPLLTKLYVPYTNFNRTSWKVLQKGIPRYMSTLKELDLSFCRQVTGDIVQDILCSVSALEVFLGDYITDTDIDDSRPWICVGLTHLTLAFVLANERVRLGAFDRLSALTKLTMLRIDISPVVYPGLGQIPIPIDKTKQHCLQLSLWNGMDALMNLKMLRILRGPFCFNTIWAMSDAEWALKHWPNLETVEGIRMEAEADKFLRDRIRVMSFCTEQKE